MLRLELCGELGRGRKKEGTSVGRAGRGAQRGMLSLPVAMQPSGLDALGMGWSAGCKLQGKEEGLSIRSSTELWVGAQGPVLGTGQTILWVPDHTVLLRFTLAGACVNLFQHLED